MQITGKLIDHRDVSVNHRDLEWQLKSLHQTLIMTGLAVDEYKNGPLGPCLIKVISTEIIRCCMVLQELLLKVNGTCMGLKFTKIGSFWRPVWWERWEGDEMISLRWQVSPSRKSFDSLLMALHSCVFTLFFFYYLLPKYGLIEIQCCLDGARKKPPCRSRIVEKIT